MKGEYGFAYRELARMDPAYLRGRIDERRIDGTRRFQAAGYEGKTRRMSQREAERIIERAKTEAA